MGRRRGLLAIASAAALLAASAGTAQARDYATTARNIIPSGQVGTVPPPAGADRQAKMYDGLTPLFDKVGRKDLFRYFKSERLGSGKQGPMRLEAQPRPGVKLLRDSFDVPHVTGKTNDDVTFASGWVTAEDRGLLLEQARYNSRVAAIGAPGLQALDLISSLRSFDPSGQTEAKIAKQTSQLMKHGRKGRAVLHDIDVFIQGINAYQRSTGSPNKPWTRNDVYALNALKGQFVGEGGGGEVASSELLSGLRGRLHGKAGYSVWNDLRERQDPETPVSVDGKFPYGPNHFSRKGNVVLQDGSFTAAKGVSKHAAAAPAHAHASNVLMVSGKRSTSGRPLMVGGPQIGYYYPGLTLEMDLKGPGWQARGATSAPFPGYILIGRGPDSAWSLTSAGADIVDDYAETLCGGSDTKYLYKGRCREMGRFDAGHLGAGDGEPAREVEFNTTVHGPVVGYALAKGKRVAISRKRSSYGRDVVDQLLYRDLTRNKVKSVGSFYKAAAQTPQTFNSFYINDRHIAMYTSGRLPIRPKGVDPGLPTDGRGKYEWRGLLSAKAHPHGSDPRSGYLVNWNNKPARGFPAADDQFAYGSVQRVDMLNRNLRKHKKQNLARVTAAMNAAATQDIRAVRTVPLLASVLRGSKAPSARARQMLDVLVGWHERGSSRLDRDLDGKIDDPGAAILDTAWPGLADAVMAKLIGPQLADQLDNSGLMSRFDSPPGGQFGGWHIYMDKDLRTLLGRKVKGKFRNRYCGGGRIGVCRADLWQALDRAGTQLAASQGPNPAGWRASATDERIKFVPGLLPTTMRYTNRPTGIQQVISFKGHRK